MSGMHGNRVRRAGRVRMAVQLGCAALTNGYAKGFASGKVWAGTSKAVCVPVLNCSSCPGSLGSCPIGALQAVGGSARHTLAFYVLGSLALVGVLFGRLVCGFACPFGFVQDLLGRVPLPKPSVPTRLDKALRKVKYLVLALLVVGLPLMAVTGSSVAPLFCKYFCPAGTLEAGIPLLVRDATLRPLAKALFGWKLAVLAAIVTLSTLVSRPFCKWFCPLGAFYSLFNRFSLYRMSFDTNKCVGCKACMKVCPMGIDVRADANGAECIRCGLCRAACPTHAIMAWWDIPAPSVADREETT